MLLLLYGYLQWNYQLFAKLNRQPCLWAFCNQIVGALSRVVLLYIIWSWSTLWYRYKFRSSVTKLFSFQILPTAQRLLDELLSSQQTAINTVCGAPGLFLHFVFSVNARTRDAFYVAFWIFNYFKIQKVKFLFPM